MPEAGYVNYFEILGVGEKASPGEVRKTYKAKMKKLVGEIARSQITAERRAYFLLEMAKLNAAVFILRDNERRKRYWDDRTELIRLEEDWRNVSDDPAESDRLRRKFEAAMRHFLSTYVEEAMLEAGRDKEVVEASHWDAAHERHASAILRRYRHHLYHDVLERLPFYEVTKPEIDWDERAKTAAELVAAEAG